MLQWSRELMNSFNKDFYVYECFPCMYVCVPQAGSVLGGQKRVSGSLDHVGIWNWALEELWHLWKSSQMLLLAKLSLQTFHKLFIVVTKQRWHKLTHFSNTSVGLLGGHVTTNQEKVLKASVDDSISQTFDW